MRAYERLLKYVTFETQSSEETHTTPSTPNQKVFGNYLVNELKELGRSEAAMDENGYVYATIPATDPKAPVIGLIAHMDTAPSASDKNVKASVIRYEGGDIVLNEENNIIMKADDFEHLKNYIGQELIVTDGTTLLGADDKAGVAEIVTLVEELMNDQTHLHGKIRIAFTPDEEIGEGADHFNVKEFGAEYAYTVDGGALGELEYENFNAAWASVTINGVNIHPGEAKNKMRNASLYAMEFNQMLPADQIPANTEGYEGFFHLCEMNGTEEQAHLKYIIRDHDRARFEERKAYITRVVSYLNQKYGEETVELEMNDSYYNMKEKIEPCMYIVERAKAAMEKADVVPVIVPIRGGTDGARLSYEGLPCPNLSTGGHNFHGRFEYIPVVSMDKMVQVLKEIVKSDQNL